MILAMLILFQVLGVVVFALSPTLWIALAGRWGRDAAIFSAGISSIYMDDTQRLLHAFSDDPDVNALDGENFPNQVSGHRARRMDPRSTHATWVLHLRVATKKPAVRC